MLACETDTKVTLDGKMPPTFKLSGSGSIFFLRIIEATSEEESIADVPAIWEIKPHVGLSETNASRLPEVTYGMTPPGFVQAIPAQGEPPPLEEGKVYNLWAPTLGANGGGIRFTIRDGKSIEVPTRRLR
jgi:hypothetical protein